MKLYVDGELFNVGGLALTDPDDRPSKCSNWDEDFGSAEEDDQCGAGMPRWVDLRRYMTPVEDQKQVGSCTANAVAGAYEYLCNVRARQTGDTAGDISRLFIYYVARKRDQERRGTSHLRVTDSGSTISGAVDALIKKGACLEETYPYNTEVVNYTPHSETFKEALNYRISKCMKVRTDLNEFKHVLSKGYPIIIGCKLTEAFHRTRGRGIIPVPNPHEERAKKHGLHAMLVVGYYDSHKVFVVRNSWGKNWGYGGYCFMPYNYVANREFNLDDNYAIRGLTDYDFTPDDDDGCMDLDFTSGDIEMEDVEIYEADESDDEDGEEEDDEFDEDLFNELKQAKDIFSLIDVDGSGHIDMEELETVLKLSGHFVSDEIIEEIMEEYDLDGNGTLGFKEFLQILEIEDVSECDEEECEEEEEVDCEDESEEDEEVDEEDYSDEDVCDEDVCDDDECDEDEPDEDVCDEDVCDDDECDEDEPDDDECDESDEEEEVDDDDDEEEEEEE